jgi:hypothetical protein
MKTQLYNILLLVIAMTLVVGCNEKEFLTETDPNQVVGDDFWKSEEDAVAAMATIYSPLRGQMYGFYGAFTGLQTMNIRGEDVWYLVDDPESWKIANFINTPNTGRNDFSSAYRSIHRANVFLANIDRVPMDENTKKEMIAEAYFLRGMNYFLLVTNYGNVPIRIKPVETTDDINLASSPEADVWKQVEEDFKAAKAGLPVDRPSEELGRVTKGAAIAYLGKSYAYQKKYDLAETELEIIMKPPYAYDLVADYQDNFTDVNEHNEESILEWSYEEYGNRYGMWGSEGSNSPQSQVMPQMVGTPASGGWFKFMPTPFVVNAFIKEERTAGADTRFDKRMYTNLFWQYSDLGDVRDDETWYGEEGYDFDDLWLSTSAKRQAGGEPDYSNIGGRFLIKKFTNFYTNNAKADNYWSGIYMTSNLRVMRFAEVLLLHAEAAAHNGHEGEAVSDLNRIRARAGLEEGTWAGEAALMEEIEHQRLLELFFEGHRFYDLVRWHDAATVKSILTANKKQGAQYFQAKHKYLPIPQSEVDTNTELEQHPLWKN